MSRRTTRGPRQVNPCTHLCSRQDLLLELHPCCSICSAALWQPICLLMLILSAVQWPRSCAVLVPLSPSVPQQMFPFQFVSWGGESSLARQGREGEKWCNFWQLSRPLFSTEFGQSGQQGEPCIWGQAANPPVPFSALNMGLLRCRRKIAVDEGTGIAVNKEVCGFPCTCQSK